MSRRSFSVVALTMLLLALGSPSAPAKPKVRDLLPDLVPISTRTVATGGPVTCQPVEMVEQGARRCLRFDQTIANFGDGPFEIRYGIETLLSTQELRQRIYRSDGTTRDRLADHYEFHAAHAHFHYKSFGLTRLWASDQAGTRFGVEPVRDGRKNGFCVVDVENRWAGQPGSVDEPHYQDPQCQVPSDLSTGVEMVQGISKGWADIYAAHVEGQYVEITGVPDGFYLLETIADPENTVLEGDERNNSVFTHVQLCNDFAQLYPPPPGFDFCP
ncbi:MAG TPA: lysyl oxidase family protein [Acidimicrobiales bacterium]|nr:lysyl oxidase family protein [Acidimicrobiales bacterium]